MAELKVTTTTRETSFTDEEVTLIRDTVAKDATDAEFSVFLRHCRKTGLDPLARQIYFQKRKGKMVIVTSIDGYRLNADRSGVYAGSTDPVFDGGKTQYELISAGKLRPVTATVTVRKVVSGIIAEFTATATWDSYYPGDGPDGWAWRKMPFLMLGKVAEALAMRKAFPAELSGMYVQEEMDQDRDKGPEAPTMVLEDRPPSLTSPDTPEKAPESLEWPEVEFPVPSYVPEKGSAEEILVRLAGGVESGPEMAPVRGEREREWAAEMWGRYGGAHTSDLERGEMEEVGSQMLIMMAYGDRDRARGMLETFSSWENKKGELVQGKTRWAEMSDRQVPVVWRKVRDAFGKSDLVVPSGGNASGSWPA